MFDIAKVKVGDYIETRDSEIGYITNIKESLFLFRYKTKNRGLVGYCGNILDLGKDFKQIGTYVFEDKDKVKIEPLTSYVEEVYAIIRGGHNKVTEYKHEPSKEQIVGKINEIIKWINERG